MNDQTTPAVTDDDRRQAYEWAEFVESDAGAWAAQIRAAARVILDAVPAPSPPTLADMTPDEQDECTGMQADLAQGDRVVILDGTPDHDDRVQVLESTLDVYRPVAADVTPRPELTRLTLPGTEKPAPAPALPGGWRLAEHKDHGRVIVTNPTPDSDGRVYYVRPSDGIIGNACDLCSPSELTYIDAEPGEAPVPPNTLAVGSVIESADDPRIDALPVGSILLDREGETAINRGEAWTGVGYTPIPSEGDEFGPWTVLHIPKEADQ